MQKNLLLNFSFFQKNAGNNRCYLDLQGQDLHDSFRPIWILGQAFMRSWYIVYDFESYQVGLGSIDGERVTTTTGAITTTTPAVTTATTSGSGRIKIIGSFTTYCCFCLYLYCSYYHNYNLD